jgi:hypothetical protein
MADGVVAHQFVSPRMTETQHVVPVTSAEMALLDLLRSEPQLVENLRKCTADLPHQQSMLNRLRIFLVRAIGAQRHAAGTARRTRAD